MVTGAAVVVALTVVVVAFAVVVVALAVVVVAFFHISESVPARPRSEKFFDL